MTEKMQASRRQSRKVFFARCCLKVCESVFVSFCRYRKDLGFMRIIGIDPGYAIVGFGILEYDGSVYETVDYGAVTTKAGENFNYRLRTIYEDFCTVLDRYCPECMAMERLFFQNNQKTAIDVAEARGILLLAATQRDIPIYEYTPLQVKLALVGYGKATKKQMQEMTRRVLRLTEIPKPDDTADALAMAICHAHTSSSSLAGLSARQSMKRA